MGRNDRTIFDSLLIDDGDTVIMQPVTDQKTVKNGAIVAAHVSGKTTLKYYQKKGSKVILMPGNPDRTLYPETELKAVDVEVQDRKSVV